MNKSIFQPLRDVGFAKQTVETAMIQAAISGPHFMVSEQRKTLGEQMKFLAHLSYLKKEGILKIRSYDTIYLRQLPSDSLTIINGIQVSKIARDMDKINWNDKSFNRDFIAAFGRDIQTEKKAEKIEDQLNRLTSAGPLGLAEAEKLRLKFQFDTHYGNSHGLDSDFGMLYAKYYPVLSLNHETGMLPIKDAAFLLLKDHIGNHLPSTAIRNAVREITAPREQFIRRMQVRQIPPIGTTKRKIV